MVQYEALMPAAKPLALHRETTRLALRERESINAYLLPYLVVIFLAECPGCSELGRAPGHARSSRSGQVTTNPRDFPDVGNPWDFRMHLPVAAEQQYVSCAYADPFPWNCVLLVQPA